MNSIAFDKSGLNQIQKLRSFCLICIQFVYLILPLTAYTQINNQPSSEIFLEFENDLNSNSKDRDANSKTENLNLTINQNTLKYNLEGKNILIDSRKPIAGNGDTASSLFLIQNILANGYLGVIDILSDDRSEKIMNTIAQKLPNFWEHVRIIKGPLETTKTYDLVFRSGQPSGRILIDQLNFLDDQNSQFMNNKINLAKDSVIVSTPIYGNSTNPNSIQPLSLIKINEIYNTFQAPGLNTFRDIDQLEYDLNDLKNNQLVFNEAGIFHDPFSLAIRQMNLAQVEQYIIHQSSHLSEDLHQLFSKSFRFTKANSIGYTLAYGFSIGQVRSQAVNYFRSLLSLPQPTIVITPSSFSTELYASFSDDEKKMISVKKLDQLKNEGFRFPNKKIVVIQIPNIPHHIFAALLLASYHKKRVPLGAGDGFFTTAVSLGIPFAPTVVDWNIRNIRSLGLILQMQANMVHDLNAQLSIDKIFPINGGMANQLQYSQSLISQAQYFQRNIQIIPNLFTNLIYQIEQRMENLDLENQNLIKFKTNFLSKFVAGTNFDFTSRYCQFVFK